jgi:N-acyl-D-aspartate/D-glutamate deacylase
MEASMDIGLVIRGGTIVDGSGDEPYEGDVAIANGRIVQIGKNLSVRGTEEIDACGQIVTPGFVDIHTHYDGQVTWENRIIPSSHHGVTTVVMGNCGVGFAPCRPADRTRLIYLMEGIEDLPEIVLSEGLPWNWETFPQYLDALAARVFDTDIATQLPHAALRVYAMGERASDREVATAEDRAVMARMAREAIQVGALGFATSRTINHRGSDGRLVPTLTAAEEELTQIGEALGALGRGVMQLISDFTDIDEELGRLRRIAEKSRRPLSISILPREQSDAWRQLLHWIERCNADGLEVRGQVCGRPTGLLLGFEMSRNPFYTTPTFKRLKSLSQEDRVKALRQSDVRARLLSENPEPDDAPGAAFVRRWASMFSLGARPNYEPDPDTNIAAVAAKLGMTPEELAYDLMLDQDGQGALMVPVSYLINGTLDVAGELLRHPNTIYGLGDGGAHLGFLCDASLPTYMVQYWARDRKRGRISLSEVISNLTLKTAHALGLDDRGLVRPGYRADLNVIDFDRLELGAPRVRRDLPAGGARITQAAVGYTASIVNGKITYRDGIATGNLPGRLVRGAQSPRRAA